MVSFYNVQPSNEIESFIVFSVIRLKGEVNSFVTKFLEAFPNVFTVATENY